MLLHSIPNEGVYPKGMLQRMIANGMIPGAADLMASIDGRTHYIEVKEGKGKQKPGQEDFQARCVALNIPYGVAWSIEDVRALLAEWGVPTREVRA